MQYLLTEEEKGALVPRKALEAAEEAIEWCFQVFQPPWCPHLPTTTSEYCDGCPLELQSMGRFTNNPNQGCLPPDKISRMICKLTRRYGK